MSYDNFVKLAFNIESDETEKEKEAIDGVAGNTYQQKAMQAAQQQSEMNKQVAINSVIEKSKASKRIIDAEYTNNALAAIERYSKDMSAIKSQKNSKQFLVDEIAEASAKKVLGEIDIQERLKSELEMANAEAGMQELAAQQGAIQPPSAESNRVNSALIAQTNSDQQQAQQAQQAQAQQVQEAQAQEAQAQQAGAQPPPAQQPPVAAQGGAAQKNNIPSGQESIAATAGGGAQNVEAPKTAAEKVSRFSSGYIRKSPISNKSCSKCNSFDGMMLCQKVKGEVDPKAVCDLFSKKV